MNTINDVVENVLLEEIVRLSAVNVKLVNTLQQIVDDVSNGTFTADSIVSVAHQAIALATQETS